MTNEILGYKLLLNYEVKQENLQEYYQFMMGQYVPALQAMGMQMSEAWQTAYGDAPERLVGFVCEDKDTLTAVLNSDNWITLNEQLENLVIDFGYKAIPYRGGFQF
jgi:hypothetical protein